jgi:uncharacterized protein YjbJ (UPF0337 family)
MPGRTGNMNWQQVEARWKQARGKVKEKWVRLTEDDLEVIGGRRERLESKIHERYGFTTDHVRKEIEDWARCQPAAPRLRSSSKTKLALPRIGLCHDGNPRLMLAGTKQPRKGRQTQMFAGRAAP